MNNNKLITAVAAGVLLFITGCTKDSILMDTKLSYSFSAINLNASFGAGGTADGTIVPAGTPGSINWTSAKLNVTHTEFSGTDADGNPVSASETLTNVNVLNPSLLAGDLYLKSGVYQNIKFKLSLTASATNPPLEMQGDYIDPSGNSHPVIVKLNTTQMLNLVDLPNQGIGSGNYVLKIRIKLNEMIKDFNYSDINDITFTGNTIMITDTMNKPLFDKLVAKLPAAMEGEFYKE